MNVKKMLTKEPASHRIGNMTKKGIQKKIFCVRDIACGWVIESPWHPN